jgi:hypothetical protein
MAYPLRALRLAGRLALSLRAISMRMRPAVRCEHTILVAVEWSESVFSRSDLYAQLDA